MDNEKAPYRDQIMAALALMDRGCGRPAVGIFHGTSGSVLSGPDTAKTPMTSAVARYTIFNIGIDLRSGIDVNAAQG